MSILPVVSPVIYDRSLKCVLLPAPLRPMNPDHFALADLEIDVPQYPEALLLLPAIAEGRRNSRQYA